MLPFGKNDSGYTTYWRRWISWHTRLLGLRSSPITATPLVAVRGVTPAMFGGADGGTSGTNPLKLIIATNKTSVKSKRCVITSMPTRTVRKLWFDSSIQKPYHSDYFHTTKEMKIMAYTTPKIEKIADYSDATCGAWRGRGADLHRGRMFVWFWSRYFTGRSIDKFHLTL